eukprot:gene14173-15652_t
MANENLTRRTLRNKEKKSYQDNLEDEIEGKRRFDVHDKLSSDKYVFDSSESLVLEMEGKDFNFQYIQEHGFKAPIKFTCKDGLGLRAPDADKFDLNDVKYYVGGKRMVDVVDSNTQQPVEMTMSQWVKYFTNPNRDRILNVISLEFSHTGMDRLVEPPELVRKIDWVNVMWPPELIEAQTDTTNNLDDMKYPKVKKYVLMSVAGCYTDFHIDFGGTSVWYHIIKGEKIFWMIEPNHENLMKYEKWTLSTKQEDVFFGDLVDRCTKVHLQAGDTFMIPSGWIHAVHTPADSLVFGGNFIHSFSIGMQIKISEIEHKTKVPNRFRFPFYPQIHWYTAKRYIELLEKDLDEKEKKEQQQQQQEEMNKDNTSASSSTSDVKEFLENKENLGVVKNSGKKVKSKKVKMECADHTATASKSNDATSSDDVTDDDKEAVQKEAVDQEPKEVHWEPINMTDFEVDGLKHLIQRLKTWDRAIQNCPEEITDQEALLDRLTELVEMHEDDDQWLATRGIDIFDQYDQYFEDTGCASPTIRQRQKAKKIRSGLKVKGDTMRRPKKTTPATRKRRLRCGGCEGCTRDNCGECKYCLDMPKFGGPGRMKQSCIFRICLNPTLPTSAKCSVCDEVKTDDDNPIMECSICAALAHPNCFENKGPCKISESLNNCWECPNCCQDEEAGDFDPNLVRGKMDPLKRKLAASVGSTEPKDEDGVTKKRRKSNVADENADQKRKKKTRGYESDPDQEMTEQQEVPVKERKKSAKKDRPTVHVVVEAIDPKYVVRPRPVTPPPNEVELVDNTCHPVPRDLWLRVFSNLSQSDLCLCMRVCRTWNRWAMTQAFWQNIDASNKKVTSVVLEGIVRRQPTRLSLAHCNVTFNQVKWLLARIPRLSHLNLQGNTFTAVAALFSSVCPPLQSLDISLCEGVRDELMLKLLSPAADNNSPANRGKNPLINLQELSIAGCDVTDESIRYVSRFLPSLEKLDVSYCGKITDAGVDVLTSETSICRDILTQVDLSGCKKLTTSSLEFLMQCSKEPRVVVERCDKLILPSA